MNEHEILDTIQKLIKATGKDRLKWDNTADDDIFRANFKSAVLHIVKEDEGRADTGPEYAFVVLDEDGRELTRYASRDAKNLLLLGQLWESARRNARNIDKVFPQLRAEIDSLLRPSEK